MTQPFHDPASPRRPHRRRTAFVLVGALIASGVAALVAGPSANAAVIDPAAYYQIVSRHSGKAVEIADQSTADGAVVQQRTRADQANQQFQFVDAGHHPTSMITNCGRSAGQRRGAGAGYCTARPLPKEREPGAAWCRTAWELHGTPLGHTARYIAGGLRASRAACGRRSGR
ncbi:RICIN domain-containing protein [Saccharothrix deserti]|uniref:RICIN domain-containing protein n=1 Tax=Saccharothrix deserti TaxID=2593674 RepID=UPI00131E8692|nr:RICIN domain-containing protein [Saccharothrix deserti]